MTLASKRFLIVTHTSATLRQLVLLGQFFSASSDARDELRNSIGNETKRHTVIFTLTGQTLRDEHRYQEGIQLYAGVQDVMRTLSPAIPSAARQTTRRKPSNSAQAIAQYHECMTDLTGLLGYLRDDKTARTLLRRATRRQSITLDRGIVHLKNCLMPEAEFQLFRALNAALNEELHN